MWQRVKTGLKCHFRREFYVYLFFLKLNSPMEFCDFDFFGEGGMGFELSRHSTA
jgi:hypothetical protein